MERLRLLLQVAAVVSTSLLAAVVVGDEMCTIYVATHGGNDSNPGTSSSPLKTVEAAVEHRMTSPACGHRHGRADDPMAGELATILVREGKYYIENPPLVLGKAASNTAVRAAEGAAVTLSAGALVDDGCWKPRRVTSDAAVWACTLPASMQTTNPSTGDLFQTLYANAKRLRKARFPNHDPTSSEKGWLIINTSHWLGPNNGSKFVVGVKADTLPAAVLDPLWAGGTVHIFPSRSWINIVNVTFKHLPPSLALPHRQNEPARLGDDSLRHFEVTCPPVLTESGAIHEGGLCTNTSNSASILPGNRFFIEGGDVVLDAPGEWAYTESTRTLLVAVHSNGSSNTGSPPTSVVIPKATAVLDISPHLPPPPPAPCAWEPTAYGRSPGSSLAALPPTTFANCTAMCCAVASAPLITPSRG